MLTSHKMGLAAGLALALSVAGCFGGGDDGDAVVVVEPPVVPAAQVPDSAGASITAFGSYLLGLGAGDEASEPLGLKDTLVVPLDETSEPQVLT